VATVPADVEGPSDAELIEAVRKGTVSAYGALYERHVAAAYNLARQLSRSPAEADDLVSEAFAKVLDTLRGGRGPDSAFRAYLLTALRHTAYDKTRRDRKVELSDDVSTVSGVSLEAVSEEFDDTAVAGLERSLAAQAFARLPERWQAVLWHTEIEGQSPAEVAPLLGLTANGVSALAYRAREGLRQAYLQVHLAETDDRHCRAAAEKLGAWTRGGLAKREKAQVEAHLDTCERCRALAAELADVNGAMRVFVAPLVLGAGALGYLATTGGAATAGSAIVAGGAAGAAGAAGGAAASLPRQFIGVALSGVALAAAIALSLAAGGERPEIPAAAPTPSPPTQQEQPTKPPPPQQQPPTPPVPPRQPPTQQEQPPQSPTPSTPPAPQVPPTPPALTPGPATPISLVAGGAPVDLPLTVRNTGGTMSDPVTATLNLPPGVSAVPVDGFTAPRLLSLNGAQPEGTVNCPGGNGTVTCSSERGLAPNESVTLLFRLVASDTAQSGQITGSLSAGAAMRVTVTVQVDVTPAPVRDSVTLAAEADWVGLFGLWFHPIVEVTVTNSGTSSLPVTVTVDQKAAVRWSSQEVSCASGPVTSCTTTAEVAPGERFKLVLEVDADPWPDKSPNRKQVHVTATLGVATAEKNVTLWDCLWPVEPVPPTQQPPHEPAPASPTPPAQQPPPNTTTTPPGTSSTKPPKPPAPTSPPVTTTTPLPSPPSTGPGRSDQPPPSSQPPTSTTPSGGLGGLLGWLLGG
jgi:RNA polymerase sigma factor (sigma-70 family)